MIDFNQLAEKHQWQIDEYEDDDNDGVKLIVLIKPQKKFIDILIYKDGKIYIEIEEGDILKYKLTLKKDDISEQELITLIENG